MKGLRKHESEIQECGSSLRSITTFYYTNQVDNKILSFNNYHTIETNSDSEI